MAQTSERRTTPKIGAGAGTAGGGPPRADLPKGIDQVGSYAPPSSRFQNSGDNVAQLFPAPSGRGFSDLANDPKHVLASAEYVGFTLTHEFERTGPPTADPGLWYSIFPPDTGLVLSRGGVHLFAGMPPRKALETAKPEVERRCVLVSVDFAGTAYVVLAGVWPDGPGRHGEIWDAVRAISAAAAVYAGDAAADHDAAVVLGEAAATFAIRAGVTLPAEVQPTWLAGFEQRLVEFRSLDASPDPDLAEAFRNAAVQWCGDADAYYGDMDMPATDRNPQLPNASFNAFAKRALRSACPVMSDDDAIDFAKKLERVAQDFSDGLFRHPPDDLPTDAWTTFVQLADVRAAHLAKGPLESYADLASSG